MSITTCYDEFRTWMESLQQRALAGEQKAIVLYLNTLQHYNPSFRQIIGEGQICDQRTLLQLTVKRYQYERYHHIAPVDLDENTTKQPFAAPHLGSYPPMRP